MGVGQTNSSHLNRQNEVWKKKDREGYTGELRLDVWLSSPSLRRRVFYVFLPTVEKVSFMSHLFRVLGVLSFPTKEIVLGSCN